MKGREETWEEEERGAWWRKERGWGEKKTNRKKSYKIKEIIKFKKTQLPFLFRFGLIRELAK